MAGVKRCRCRVRTSALLLVGAIFSGGLIRPAAAQILLAAPAGGDASAEDPNKRQGFTIPTDDTLQTSFSDFERHVERKAWEKAFATLNDIPAEKRIGMLARKDGLIIPAQQRIWEAISELPADGREAFRVFYDAKARQAWQPIAEGTLPLAEQIAAAEKIHQELFLTSVGDNATDFLGDAAFERGDFEAAERYWRAVLDKHPNSDIPEERLLFKRGLALTRLGNATGAAAVRKSLEQRFAKARIRVGGQEVEPAALLAKAAANPATAAAVSDAVAASIRSAPAVETKPLWRTQFATDRAIQMIQQTMQSNYWYRNGMETLIPATATDGERLYANWFGICFAVDLKTGRLVWRSQKFSELNNHIGNLPHSASNVEAYAITAGQGIVLTQTLPLDRLNYWQEPFRLICFDATTGKEKWKTLDNASLNTVSFEGQPLIDGNRILAIGHGQQEAKFVVYSLDFDGKVQWQADLGTARKRPTPRGYEVMPQPALLRRGRSLFVCTQDGALVNFDLNDRKVRWMLTYEGPQVNNNQRFYYSGQVDQTTQLHTRTAILERDGLLYLKEAASRELVAVDPSGPSVVWRRPVEQAAQLVAVDQDNVYVLDTELLAIDRQTHALRWGIRLPIGAGGLSALVGPDSVLVLTNRGLFELERDSGDVRRIFRGADLKSAGGRLCLIGQQLIAITNISITSYGEAATTAAVAETP